MKWIRKDITGIIKTKLNIVKIQQELAKSKFNPYCEGGIKAWNATGVEERIRITFRGNPLLIR